MAVQRAMKPVATGVASSRTDLWDNPMGTDGFEFVEYTAPDPAALGRLFETHGLRRGRASSLEERHALPPGRRELHRQCRARILRAGLRPRPRAVGLRHGVPRRRRRLRLQARARAGRQAVRRQGRTDGAEHPGHRGDRRLGHLSRRPLWTERLDLRRRFQAARRRRSRAQGRRPRRRRPPHPQRAARPHDGLGGLLRAALQLPRDPLLRHRRQADRACARRR